jgi:hypothetical protein
MRVFFVLNLVVFSAACAPVPDGSNSKNTTSDAPDAEQAEETLERDETDADDSGDGEASDVEGAPSDSDSDPGSDSDSDSDPDAPDRLPRSGEYRYSFTLEEDPCGWREVMETFNDGIADVMPTEFDIIPREDGFDIEAIRFGGDFGTEGMVRCIVDGSSFACEPQPVCPVDMFLCTYGWQYEVTFTGEVLSDRVLEGTSVVRYLSVDESTADALESIGLTAPECTQTIDMRLAWDR